MLTSVPPTQSQWKPAQYYSHPALTRYFDHIQNRPAVRASAEKLSPTFPLVSFDLKNAPSQERKVEPPKKKEKKPVTEVLKEKACEVKDAVKEKVAVVSEKAATNKETKKAEKKQQLTAAANEEGGRKKAGSPPKQAAAEDVGEPQPSMIDLRVGKIIEISKHPDADTLYVEASSAFLAP
jgi:aminoacyl tRNA synthase complex-interacting multifunctional protein 1